MFPRFELEAIAHDHVFSNPDQKRIAQVHILATSQPWELLHLFLRNEIYELHELHMLPPA